MKKAIISMLFTLFIALNSSQAQTKTFSYYAKETLEAIGTSAEQNEKILGLHRATQAKIREIQKNANLSEDDKKVKYKEIYGESSKLYNEILTGAQKDSLKQYIKEFKEKNK